MTSLLRTATDGPTKRGREEQDHGGKRARKAKVQSSLPPQISHNSLFEEDFDTHVWSDEEVRKQARLELPRDEVKSQYERAVRAHAIRSFWQSMPEGGKKGTVVLYVQSTEFSAFDLIVG